jgi:hypothetical protein
MYRSPEKGRKICDMPSSIVFPEIKSKTYQLIRERIWEKLRSIVGPWRKHNTEIQPVDHN